MAAHTMQCNVVSPEHTNKQDLTFKNHPEIVSDDFLGDLGVYCCPDNADKVVNQQMAK